MITRHDGPEGRFYAVPDVGLLPSVTNVLDGGMPKPYLVPWAARQERALVLDTVYRAGPPRGSMAQHMRLLRDKLAGVPLAHQTALEEAGKIGAGAHHLVESWLRRQFPDVSLVADGSHTAFNAFLTWAIEHEVAPILIEEPVYSATLGVAGTFDLYGTYMLNGERLWAVFDWKTSRRIHLEAVVQVGIYRHCLIELGLHEVDAPLHTVIVRLPKTTKPEDQLEARHLVAAANDPLPVFTAARTLWDATRQAA